MSGVLSISGYVLLQEESYLGFYQRLLNHQILHRVKPGIDENSSTTSGDAALSPSHLNLLVVVWLEKIHPELPGLVAEQYRERLEQGAQLADQVPRLAADMSALLDRIRNLDEDLDLKYHLPEPEPTSLWGTDQLVKKIKEEAKLDIRPAISEDDDDDKFEENDGFRDSEDDIKVEMISEEEEEDPSFVMNPPTKVKRKYKKRKLKVTKAKVKRIKPEVSDGEEEGPELSCTLCEYTTSGARRLKNLRFHYKTHHGTPMLYCKSCDISFKTTEERDLHRADHRTCFRCKECPYSCKSKTSLRGHMFSKHKQDYTGKVHQCDQCPFLTFENCKLKKHVEDVHERVKKHICDECGNGYVRYEDLCKHQRIKHQGVRYYCDQCDVKTISKAQLRKHRDRVHGERKYACEKCEFKAGCQLHLRNHMITVHENVHFYPCDQCDYNARRPVLLKEHKQTKHLGLWITCDLCDHKTTRKWHMKRHMLKIHNIETTTYEIEAPKNKSA